MKPLLEIKNLTVGVEGKEILKEVSLTIKKGEIHALMGRNGSGKTSLAYTLMGHPKYKVLSGEIFFEGEPIHELPPDERARKRIFLGFQYPVAVPGVVVGNYLRSILRSVRGHELQMKEMRPLIKKEAASLGIPEGFLSRGLNEGFSGGEKKRLETLQMRLLEPKLAILDETDSGLDVDAFKSVASGIQQMQSPERSILLITHYKKMLEHIRPSHVHILVSGRIVKSGGYELVAVIDEQGFEWAQKEGIQEAIS